MKYCTKCGYELTGTETTCPKCQKSLIKKNQNIKIPKLPKLNKQHTKILILSLVSILCFSFGLLGLNNYFDNPSRIVDKFKIAASTNDVKTMASLISSEDPRMKIDKKTIQPLANYLKENPSYLNEVINDIHIQEQTLKRTEGNTLYNNNNNMLTLKKKGHNLLFFPKYIIEIKPYFIDLSLKIKDAKVKLNGDEICTSDKDDFKKELGPIIPGKYTIVASYKNKYINANETKDIDLIPTSNDNKTSLDMLSDVKYVDIESDAPNAILYVDGKSADITLSQAKHFGPLNNDTKLFAVEKLPEGSFKSEEVTANGSSVYLSFEDAKTAYSDFGEKLSYLMSQYTYNFAIAVNNNDFSLIESYLYPNSTLYNSQKKAVSDIAKAGFKEECLSCQLVNYNYDEKTQEGSLVVNETYNITKNDSTKSKSFTNTYKFKYNLIKKDYQLTELVEK